MALNFPASPSVNDTYVSGGITYTWDGTSWKASSSFNETDPVFTASPAFGIDSVDISNWNTAYGWGDHSTQGYITAETDSLDDVVGRGSSTTSSVTVGGVTVSNDGTSNGSVSISDAGAYSEIVFRASNGTTQSKIQGDEANLYLQSGASGLAWVNTYSIFYPNGDVFLNNGQQGNTTIGGTLTAGGLTYPTTNGTAGQVLSSNGSGNVVWKDDETGSSLQSRASAQATTNSISNNVSDYITITAAKTYVLQKIQTSAAAWVTVYTDMTSRFNDATRNETTDPLPGSGVVAEVITTEASTQKITPGTIGWNDDDIAPSSNVYLKVVNKSGSTQAITVTLHYVQIEA
jgi:hypothetical protein